MSDFLQDAQPVVNNLDQVSNTISAFMSWVDDTVLWFSQSVYESLVADNTGLIVTLFALSIALYGWLILHGKLEFTTRESVNHMLLLGAVAVLLTNYDSFNQLVYGWFTLIPDSLAGSIVNALHDKDLKTDSGMHALALFVDRTMRVVMLFWQGDLSLKIGAIGIAILSELLFGMFLTILLVAKLCVGVLLAEAPIFLLFGIFKSTRGILEGWVRQLWSMFMVQIMGLGMMTVTIMIMRHPVSQIEGGRVVVSMESALNFMLIIIPLLWLARQMFGMAQAIAGGFVMQQYGALNDGVIGQGQRAWSGGRNAWKGGRQAWDAGKKGAQWVRSRFV